MSRHLQLGLSTLILALVSVSAASAARVRGPLITHPSHASDPTDNCNKCADELGGGGYGHAFEGGAGAFFTGNHVQWRAGLCAQSHQNCAPSDFDLASVADAVQNRDFEAIVDLIDRYPTLVELEASRGVVLVRNCGQQYIAMYSLDSGLASRVATLLDE